MKKLIFNRFGVPGRLFMLGLAISAFVLLNIADVISRVQKEEAGINRFAYSEVYWVRPEDTLNFHLKAPSLTPEIISAIQSVECNVSFYELPVYVNHQIDFMQAELIMNLPEDLRLTSRDKKPIHIPETENGIVIGESMIELTENGEGKILDLGDIKVPVAEVLKDDNPAKIDYSMYMFRENADESFREYLTSRITERLEEMFLQVRFFGDDPIDNDVRKFTEAMSELGLVCVCPWAVISVWAGGGMIIRISGIVCTTLSFCRFVLFLPFSPALRPRIYGYGHAKRRSRYARLTDTAAFVYSRL